jgi:hypothetical protein
MSDYVPNSTFALLNSIRCEIMSIPHVLINGPVIARFDPKVDSIFIN